jgi:hypothetical protein
MSNVENYVMQMDQQHGVAADSIMYFDINIGVANGHSQVTERLS